MRQLTAIMFTDLVGFSAMMEEDEARATDIVRRHRAVMDGHVQAHGGRILQFYGDGTLSTFPSAVGAVESAIQIQRALIGSDPIPLRIGIHTGDIVHDETGVYGDGVNVAARIQSVGVAGSVLISAKVSDELKNHPGIRTRSLGRFDLKNLRQPLELLAVSAEGLSIPGPEDLPIQAERHGRSVAVLPFVNMSAHPDNEFFSDGITEDIINVLTRIDGLKVTARTSSFAFKGRSVDVREIARDLGVGTVLEGSVRRAGERVRVTAQLIDAQTGYHLFSKAFDRAIEDIFRVQDDISSAIVEELQMHLGELRPAGSESSGEVGDRLHAINGGGESCDCNAYTEYAKGLHQFNQWTRQGAEHAIRHFERAAELDETWGQPLAMKAGALTFLAALGYRAAAETYPAVEEATRRALDLDPELGVAHAMLGAAQLFAEWDFEGAYASFQRALTLNPSSAQVHQLYAFYLRAIGALEESVQELQSALSLDPLSFPVMAELAGAYISQGRPDRALELSEEGLTLQPAFRMLWEEKGWALLSLERHDEAIDALRNLPRLARSPSAGAGIRGYAFAVAGRFREAREMLELLRAREARSTSVRLDVDFALVHAGLGETEAAIDHMERAADLRHAGAVYFWLWPQWADLRGHPRFQALIQRIRGDGVGSRIGGTAA